ncbi:DgyrCDS5202 [Dimorphilus gyrociliatus]|uniref:DgyrCDS5202 n=1 Tax=Dimorphilus gyrociliatus TaxID=2664684 RepID=A0A7I8VJ53_9ANNE|nr:DgyrCDS5202 [Dimorphilus gyrociliatus]
MNKDREALNKKVLGVVSDLVWIKIVAIGDLAAGKTCLIKHICESKYSTSYQPTVGVDYGFKIHDINNEELRVHLWDLSGSDEYFEVRNELYNGTDAFLFVFDVTNSQSFDKLDYWFKETNKYCTNDFDTYIIGNKTDLRAKRIVPAAEGKRYASSRKSKYFETSCQSGEGINGMFNESVEISGKAIDQVNFKILKISKARDDKKKVDMSKVVKTDVEDTLTISFDADEERVLDEEPLAKNRKLSKAHDDESEGIVKKTELTDESKEETFIVKVDDASQNALDSDLPGVDDAIRQEHRRLEDAEHLKSTKKICERNATDVKKTLEYQPADNTEDKGEPPEIEERAMKASEELKDTETRDLKTLWISNLPYSVKATGLKELFSKYGNVLSAKVVMKKENEERKMFGLIVMKGVKQAHAALEGLNGIEFMNRSLFVERANPRIINMAQSIKPAVSSSQQRHSFSSENPPYRTDEEEAREYERERQREEKKRDAKRRELMRRRREEEERRNQEMLRKKRLKEEDERKKRIRFMEKRRLREIQREKERQREIQQMQRVEMAKLEREKEKLRIERERFEREKFEMQRLERERIRMERERIDRERQLERDREQLRHFQRQLDEQRKAQKRNYESRKNPRDDWDNKRRLENNRERNRRISPQSGTGRRHDNGFWMDQEKGNKFKRRNGYFA